MFKNKYYCIILLTVFMILDAVHSFGEIVLNEIHYNPPDNHLEDGSYREFMELYNPGRESLDLSGYRFVEGVFYDFPAGTQIGPDSYLVVVRVPTHSTWRNKNVLGPYAGKLSDSGETISLERPDGSLAFRVTYSDSPPWPLGPDGYGASLERIAWDLPADDFHSWRASLQDEGTPGSRNSNVGQIPRPMIQAVDISPRHPLANDTVTVRVGFDTPEIIAGATLFWERAGVSSTPQKVTMREVSATLSSATYEAVLPLSPSQTVVRCNVAVQLTDGGSVLLPHPAEPAPFFSYFVYDGEVNTRLPILWLLPPTVSRLLPSPRPISGVVCLRSPDAAPEVFDGAEVRDSYNGQKVRFLKGAEFYGDRTINIIPETPVRGTNPGSSAPFREHLGFWFYREMNIPSPWAEFYRMIALPRSSTTPQAQRLVIQQVNEQFLLLNNRSPQGDLYKLVYSNPNWEKHTNKDEGTGSIEDLLALLNTRNLQMLRIAMESSLELDEFLRYSVASVLTSNWDGFWNNNWMYLDPGPFGKWEIIPWDLDWLWGSTTRELYAAMPTTFPIDGVAIGGTQASRNPGPVTSKIHRDAAFHQQYILSLRDELNRHFTEEKLFGKIDEMKSLLTTDLRLLENQTGANRAARYQHIEQGYTEIQTFISRRIEYLHGVLPVSVEQWQLY
ncbi:MAG: hypothetical protein C4527_23595 [Candidatus Omnitrophota bacterium]|jgi:hypothetical protein|nr:MAG: hypothetical protein C4527_23595 [Candidatus Omnitrophota bacterium]